MALGYVLKLFLRLRAKTRCYMEIMQQRVLAVFIWPVMFYTKNI